MARPLVIFLGPTGAGKSVQAARLAASQGWVHESTGSLLRAQNDPKLLRVMNEGELVASAVIDEILAKELAKLKTAKGVVLDGYPRMMAEARWLMDNISDFGLELVRVIYLAVTKQESVKRIQGRGRNDDSPRSVEEKWDFFMEDEKPVIAYFKSLNLLAEVDGMGSVDEVAARVARAL